MAVFGQTGSPKFFSPRVLVSNNQPVCPDSKAVLKLGRHRNSASDYPCLHSNGGPLKSFGLAAAHGICTNFYFGDTTLKAAYLQNPSWCLSCVYCHKLQELSQQSKVPQPFRDLSWKDKLVNISRLRAYDHYYLEHDKKFLDNDFFATNRDLASSADKTSSPVVENFPKQRADPYLAPHMDSPEAVLSTSGNLPSSRHRSRPKNYRCPYCDVCCSNQGQLKGHVRIHTGERPYKCAEKGCTRAFIRNEELTRHRRIHTGERPHKCAVCGKAFSRKDHLNKHLKVHTYQTDYIHV